MWNKLSYRKKTIVAITSILLVLLIGYFSSFQKTWESYEKYQKGQSTEGQISMSDFASLQRRYNDLDSAFTKIKNVDYDKFLINQINLQLNVNQIRLAALQNENLGNVELDVVTLTGSFKNLLKTLFYFEREFMAGHVVSSTFAMEKDKVTREENLYLSIYIQRVENHEKK